MKTDLDHLPHFHRRQLRLLVPVIVKAVRPESYLPIHEGELTDPAKYAGMLAAFTGP